MIDREGNFGGVMERGSGFEFGGDGDGEGGGGAEGEGERRVLIERAKSEAK